MHIASCTTHGRNGSRAPHPGKRDAPHRFALCRSTNTRTHENKFRSDRHLKCETPFTPAA
jgi:hypothetical protein